MREKLVRRKNRLEMMLESSTYAHLFEHIRNELREVLAELGKIEMETHSSKTDFREGENFISFPTEQPTEKHAVLQTDKPTDRPIKITIKRRDKPTDQEHRREYAKRFLVKYFGEMRQEPPSKHGEIFEHEKQFAANASTAIRYQYGDQLAELETFFASCSIDYEREYKLSPCETITNVRRFIERGFEYARETNTHTGNNAFLRLARLKELLTTNT